MVRKSKLRASYTIALLSLFVFGVSAFEPPEVGKPIIEGSEVRVLEVERDARGRDRVSLSNGRTVWGSSLSTIMDLANGDSAIVDELLNFSVSEDKIDGIIRITDYRRTDPFSLGTSISITHGGPPYMFLTFSMMSIWNSANAQSLTLVSDNRRWDSSRLNFQRSTWRRGEYRQYTVFPTQSKLDSFFEQSRDEQITVRFRMGGRNEDFRLSRAELEAYISMKKIYDHLLRKRNNSNFNVDW